MKTTLTTQATIDGQTYTFSRPRVDMASADVQAARPDGVRLVVNTQYAQVDRTRDSAPVELTAASAAALVAAGRAYQAQRHEAERAAERERLARPVATPALPPAVAALVARYGTSEAAWDAGDEDAWAALIERGL